MMNKAPGLFGITYSNRDFSQKEVWGKNQFNSSFPAALSSYLSSKGLKNIYLYLGEDLKVHHGFISTEQLYGVLPSSDDLFYAFESPYTPYQQFLIGHLPRVDLVTQSKNNGQSLRPIEIKLTALPDSTTCDFSEERFGTEMVIRPDTIVYLACSIVANFKGKHYTLGEILGNEFEKIEDWQNEEVIWEYIPKMISAIDKVTALILRNQEPLIMQPIWKTEGKSPILSKNCLDVFVWSNFAFVQLFLDVARGELKVTKKDITRQIRTIVWLFKMLYDFAQNGQINHAQIIDELSYQTRNDKAFAVSGQITHRYMACPELTKPRIEKDEIKKIILGRKQDEKEIYIREDNSLFIHLAEKIVV
jgi:hypothetical protein